MKKQEIKADPIRDRIVASAQYLSENSQKVWLGLGVVGVLILLMTLYSNNKRNKMLENNLTMGMLQNKAIYNTEYSDSLLNLYKAFCPGPITFVLKKKLNSKISKIATAGKKTVAIRFPKHSVAQKVLKLTNKPLAAPSANISNKLSPTSAKDVFEEFGKKIKIILDGGKCKIGLESTIIDLTGKPSILRPGKITKEKIEKILKKKIKIKKIFKKVSAPGQLKLHYSPGIPLEMNKKTINKQQALIGFGKKFKIGKNYFNLSKKGNLKEAANNLYKTMREIKKRKFKSIAVIKIPNKGIGYAINDRLKKASNK